MPDALTAHYADGGLSGALLQAALGAPYTFTGHSLGAQKMDKLGANRENLAELDSRFHFARRTVAERVGMNHAGRVVTSTGQERREQYAHRAYQGAVDPADDGKFAVIPPGVNRRIFTPEPQPGDAAIQERLAQAFARDLGPERSDLPLVICSSRLDARKNHLDLVRAFGADPALLQAANLGIVVRGLEDPLHCYGSLSPDEKQIMNAIVQVAEAQGLWGAVTAFPLNSQEELAAAYRLLAGRRSVFALTALHEPFGLAPLEAMSCGLPAVVTKHGGPTESLREGPEEFGVLVDPVDPNDIARGLLRVLQSPAGWAQYREAGMGRVLSRYTWDRTAAAYLQVLQELVGGVPQREPDLIIPAYFTAPIQENDIQLDELASLYLGS
jgi:sucrose-phosphate synthase